MAKEPSKVDDQAAIKNNPWGSQEYQDSWDRIFGKEKNKEDGKI